MNARRLPEETIAAIVADYKAGLPTLEIADKYGVSDKTVNRWTAKAGVRCKRKSQARPIRPCELCGQRTTLHVCRDCKSEGPALTGGRWVPRNGIRRWQSDEDGVAA